MSSVGATTGGWRRWLRALPPGKSSGRLRQKLIPASTSRTPWSTFSGVIRLMRPSSSSSPQSPHVEPSGRCCQRLAMVRSLRGCAPGVYRSVRYLHTGSRCTQNDDTVSGIEEDTMTQKDFVVSADGHLLEPTDLFRTRLPEHLRDRGGVGGGLRDRAVRRGRRPALPPAPHRRLRGLDDLPVPPDQRPHARGRPRADPRGHGHRRRRRPGDAPEPLAVRPLLRRPRALDRPRPRLQRLRHRAVLAVLRPHLPDRADPALRRRRRRRRDRAGGRRPGSGRCCCRPRRRAATTPRDLDPVWDALSGHRASSRSSTPRPAASASTTPRPPRSRWCWRTRPR